MSRCLSFRRGRRLEVAESSSIRRLFDDDHDRRADRDLRARGLQVLGEDAVVLRFEIYGGLVRLDLADDVARAERGALLHVPFCDRALLHRRRERREPYDVVRRQRKPARRGEAARGVTQHCPEHRATVQKTGGSGPRLFERLGTRFQAKGF